ncbi:UPF0755 protein [Peptoclostridium litorale DSM 5388]|uniref:Endolytic murein transglycosylase n=1 Tax=Peptoclostridium litorale DSM 5388 TaxID=1121324 RepID=A0A069RIU2_PEPLI|nr:endolytic transglycosylase MltG [Peptoclostridium litorale]KDR94142.1 hypothetical protein CLIT_23c04150 [Peptoclostridium litorale DSM 5388]SIN81397.1 UPF0755 protein [Peptoclostridium litorale DSM 5388]
MKKFLALALAAIVAVLGAGMYFKAQIGPYEKNSSEYEVVEIQKGTYMEGAANILHEKKLIRNEIFFRILAKTNEMESIKAGKYKIYRSSSNVEILHMLNSGDTFSEGISVTIPEGFESYKIANRLEEIGIASSERFMELVNTPSVFYDEAEFLKGEDIKTLEGFLFPDTYYFEKDDSEEQIIAKMLKRFKQVYAPEYEKKQEEMGLTLNEIITMASLVEREAKADSERELVSSVFYNRLKLERRLESCATVQYILKERKANLSYADLEIDSPYNTYKYAGLPPSAIASPGQKSIKAALYPADADYLYFVAKKDGSHTFSKTYKEHLEAKKKNFSE